MAKIAKVKKAVGIPTASMADISFLLLLFFMVTTVFVKERGLKIQWAKAQSIEKIPRKNAATVYVSKAGQISIDDFIIEIPQVSLVMQKKLAQNFNLIVSFRTDKNTEYGVMADIMDQLREANALRVSFEAKQQR